jgi:hypothetical protein
MAETTTNLGKKTVVTALSDSQRVVLTDSNGAVNSITGDNLRTYIQNGISPSMIYDNILIAFCEGDAYMRMVHLDDWVKNSLDSTKTATGVVVSEGGKVLVVAPTGAALKWSSAAVTGGGVMASDRTTAINDWAGKANTAAQVKHSECADTDYAPGFCYNYTRLNSSGHGIGAGQWWLPSSGELNMIWNHINGINYALSLITGAEQIPWLWHWSSTEYSADYAWHQSFTSQYGRLGSYYKATRTGQVRPVSAYNAV